MATAAAAAAAQEGWRDATIRFAFQGKVLQPQQRLQEVGIANGSVVIAVVSQVISKTYKALLHRSLLLTPFPMRFCFPPSALPQPQTQPQPQTTAAATPSLAELAAERESRRKAAAAASEPPKEKGKGKRKGKKKGKGSGGGGGGKEESEEAMLEAAVAANQSSAAKATAAVRDGRGSQLFGIGWEKPSPSLLAAQHRDADVDRSRSLKASLSRTLAEAQAKRGKQQKKGKKGKK